MPEPTSEIYHGRTLKNRISTWFAATRPAFLSASVLPVMVAGTLVGFDRLAPETYTIRLLVCMLAIALVHAGANVLNDAFDDANGTDAANVGRLHPYTGGARFIQNGVLTHAQSLRLGLVLLLSGSVIGLIMVALTGPELLLVGAIGVVLAVTYTAPPCLVCRGLGDLVIAITFGLLPLVGVSLVLTGHIPLEAWWVGAGLGCFAAAILWINAIPDISADRSAGKLTLPARLGPKRAARLVSAWFVAGLAILLAAPLPPPTWIALLAAIPAGLASSAARSGNLARAIPLTIVTHAAVCVLLIIAFLIAR